MASSIVGWIFSNSYIGLGYWKRFFRVWLRYRDINRYLLNRDRIHHEGSLSGNWIFHIPTMDSKHFYRVLKESRLYLCGISRLIRLGNYCFLNRFRLYGWLFLFNWRIYYRQ